ncbi:MAG: hypothetical protein VYA30_10680 [Myxococcota bacterium]|nr:hypothetical protein [Myxococcota bacterium]
MKSTQFGLLFLLIALACAASYAQPTKQTQQVKESVTTKDDATRPTSKSANTTNQDDKVPPKSESGQSEKLSAIPGKAAPVDSDWHGRAEKWFTSTDKKERRKAMRQFTRALRKPCKFCHTTDFKGYTDRLLISQQMMAMTVEHGVECKDCHAGKDGFTKMGQTSEKMWQLVHKKKVFCEHCHVPKNRFQKLTPEGQLFKDSGP